jgi:nitrite transporter NirC
MINIGYNLLGTAAEKKISFFKKAKIAYFISSMLAGVYVGICMITILVMQGMLNDFGGIKIIQGASFAAALSLVVFAGAELFTGNVFVMTAGLLQKTVKPIESIMLCIVCYIGNLAGSALTAVLFLWTGYLQDNVLTAATEAIDAKTLPLLSELFARGVLCNILVCVAVWCMYRMKTEGGKLMMIFWAIYLFVVCGFEHSVANMTLFSLGMMTDTIAIYDSMLVNLGVVSAGNILGGMLLALAYWVIARKSV